MSGDAAAAPDPGHDDAVRAGADDATTAGSDADAGQDAGVAPADGPVARARADVPYAGAGSDTASTPVVPPPAARRSPGADTHGQFLITSDERDRAEARLRQAVADEVLSLEEFGDRMRLLLAARTRADLHEAMVGLPADREPATRTAQRGHAVPTREQGNVIAILGSSQATGRWRPAHSMTVVAALGEAKVDLQGAEYEGDELVINAFTALGSVEIVVPEGVEVDLRGISVLGDRKVKIDPSIIPGSPVVRVEGLAVLGDITVRNPKARERYVAPDGRGAFSDRVPLTSAAPTTRGGMRSTSRFQAARRWAAGVLAALALAVPLGWVASSDEVAGALFGSRQEAVATQQLGAGDETTVGAALAFGSIELLVPEGVNVEQDGMVVFGSCNGCSAVAGQDAPTVRIRTVGAFGSVDVTRIPGAR